jgi:type IV pilus assembly protein PilA
MVRSKLVVMLLLVSAVPVVCADTPQMPQTARQALLEMFFGKTGSFEKHLPEGLRAAVRKASTGSTPSMLNAFALVTSQMQASGQELQTFEAGPILLSVENPAQHTKLEVTVLRDDLKADRDDIELGFHGYKDGQPQTAGVTPRFTVGMKQEAGIWRLAEITVSVKVSLTDPELLKTITSNLQTAAAGAAVGASHTQVQPSSWAATRSSNEASVLASFRTLLTAEVTYHTTYPDQGFACALSDMGGMGGGNPPSPQQAMLIDPRLASGKKAGYIFALSGCQGTPASRFILTAVPAEATLGMRAFCSDESGLVRFSTDGNAASCIANGKPLQ